MNFRIAPPRQFTLHFISNPAPVSTVAGRQYIIVGTRIYDYIFESQQMMYVTNGVHTHTMNTINPKIYYVSNLIH